MAKKIFVSYDFDNDRNYKNTLLMWDANTLFDFTFEDTSCDCSVNSLAAAPIKRVISEKIANSDVVLVIVGAQTHRSEWVAWEIQKAVELRRKIVAVKLSSNYTSPGALLGAGASWAMSFTLEGIKRALGY
jgi:hypothetical protein